MFMVSLISILIYFAKRNFAAVFSHILVVALIVSLSVIIKSDNARTFIVETTSFSREIGESLVNAMVGTSSNENTSKDVNTKEIVGSLWSNLVHKPWMILEFDGKYDVNDESSDSEGMTASKKILSQKQSSDEREKVFEELGVKNIYYSGRFASTVILFLITFIKLMILVAISVVQVFMQIIAISIILISPFILLIAIVPFFGGLNLIKWLGEKYLGVQITIVLLSFIIGVLLLIDSVTLTFFMDLGASFPIALMIQSVCWIMVIVFRKQLIANFNKLQRRINGSIGAGRILSKTLDKETELANKAKDKVLNTADKVTAPAREYIKDTTVNMKEAAESKIKYAGKYAAGNTRIKAAKFTSSTIDKVASKFNKNNTDVNLYEDNKIEDSNTQEYKAKVIDLDTIREARIKGENANTKIINDKKNEESEAVNLSADKKAKEEKSKNINKENEKDKIKNKVDEAKETKETIDLSKEKVKVEGNKENREKEVNISEEEKKDKVNTINKEKLNKSIKEEKELKENINPDKFNNKNKNKPIDRVEVLKTKLGVSDKQIKIKEKKLNKELKKIANGNKKGR